MILLPLWREDTLKFPLVTSGLLLINLVVFALTWPLELRQAANVGQDELQGITQKMVSVLLAPGSGITEADKVFIQGELTVKPFPSEKLIEFLRKTQSNALSLDPKTRYEWDMDYPLFDSYLKAVQTGTQGTTTVFKSWGFTPKSDWWPGLLTHEFLHEGWVHLLVNMVFLWIAGSIAEEIIGIHILWIYIAGGIAAALTQAQWGMPPNQTLIGASGAISALLGFSLLGKPEVKVKLFYLILFFLLPRYGVFDCPLWFFLPLWLMSQFFMTLMTSHSSVTEVAYAAHTGGFVFGCLMGIVHKFFWESA